MNRNIPLATVIFSLNLAWFWLGIWVPYYLLFTNYAGIGIIETIVVLTAVILELPTGALADMIGKKRTLLLVFLFSTIGSVVMAMATSFLHLLFSVLLLSIATSLYSGTRDAFLYDTLLTLKRESEYEKVLASIQKYGLISMAAASAIGGWMYTISPSLPFWAVSIVFACCGILCFWLVEPPLDTQTFTIRNYLSQMRYGLLQLLAQKNQIGWLLQLLVIGSLAKFLIEGLDPTLALGFGLQDAQLGYLYAVIPLVSAAGAYWYEKQARKKSREFWWRLVVAALIIGPVLSPVIGLSIGLGFLLLRNIFYPILETMTSSTINSFVESKYRATTLSAYNLVVTLPYVLGAAAVGYLIDIFETRAVAAGLALIFAYIFVIIVITWGKPTKNIVEKERENI